MLKPQQLIIGDLKNRYRIQFARLAVSLYCLFGITLGMPGVLTAKEPPNLLLIVADDLGWGDLGCTGSKTIKTPRIDQLAAEGVLCTQAYVASPVCSPSRAGFITGRDPRRFGYEGNLNNSASSYPSRPDLLGLPIEEHTLGDHFKAAGYATALVGKWHLGKEKQFHPNNRGFDHFCGMLNGGHPYFTNEGTNHIERNGALVEDFSSPYLTDFFSEEAVRWLNDINTSQADPSQADTGPTNAGQTNASPKGIKEKSKPWMLMLSYNAPHTPMQARDDDYASLSHIIDKKRRTYVAMVQALDRAIGRVLDHIEQLSESENTLVVFLSDNGGATNNASWNGPLSGSKGTLREGGVRVPMIWKWPSRIRTGVSSNKVVSSLDLLPTFIAAADAKQLDLNSPPSYVDKTNRRRSIQTYGAYDGVNLLPWLATGSSSREVGKEPGEEPRNESNAEGNSSELSHDERTLFWRLQGQSAILQGDKKLINLTHRPAQLFMPGSDPGEQNDLATSHREDLLRLFKLLGSWEANLGTNPIWDSSPKWWGVSGQEYDQFPVRAEPK